TIVDAQRDPSTLGAGGLLVSRVHTRRPSGGCYSLESLQGSYGVVFTFGSNLASGYQAQSVDGKGNLMRSGIINQPVSGYTRHERRDLHHGLQRLRDSHAHAHG